MIRKALRGFAAVAAVCLAARGALAATGAPGQVDRPSRREFFKDSRGYLALARAAGQRDVSLVIAAEPGATASVAAEIARLGGTVKFRLDEVGYLRARVPVGAAEELVAFRGVHAADLDVVADSTPPYMAPGMRPDSVAARPSAAPRSADRKLGPSDEGDTWPPPRPNLTLRPVFSPLKDLGALEWRAAHPTFDGRGVTVAVLDGNVDFLLPEFQVAKNLDGTDTRKVIDIVNGQDPMEDDSPQWVSMERSVSARGRKVEYAGETWTTPREGAFRIGVFDACRFPAYVIEYFRMVMNRPGSPLDVGHPIGVLWDEKTNEVWVDANQDLSFADEKAMRDFHERYDSGLLGTDDPETPVRESIPFAVQTDPAQRFVSVNVGMYGHSTMVSGAMLASRGRNGLFNGVAPGARLVSIFEGSSAHGQIESMIRAFRDPRVDAVLLEQNVFVAMPYVITDGRFTVTVICSRLIEKYGKPFFSPANNAFGLNTVQEHGLARYGFGVGAYESSENFLQLRAIHVAREDNLHWVGSFGPAGNGELQPDILAPSEVLTTSPASRPAEDGLKGVFGLSPGYGICGGTSCATPVAAGSVALLVSAAKQSGVPHDPARLHRAVTTTARRIANFEAYKQGNGLIQVGAAWKRLTELASEGAPIVVESRAPVRTVVSRWLSPPDSGPGIFEREGWRPGMKGDRTVVLTRTTGPSGPMSFRLEWVGDESGVFTSASEVSLPLRKPVELKIGIAPSGAGVHSALLSLERDGTPGFVCRMLHTVVVPEVFEAGEKWTVKREIQVDRPGMASAFFAVPPGAAAVRFELQAPKETIPLTVYPPDGREDTIYIPAKDETQARTFMQPMAGVWMVVLASRFDAFTFDEKRPSILPATPVTLSASLVGVDVASTSAASSNAGSSPGVRDLSVRVTNRFGAFQGGAASTPLAATRETREKLPARGQTVHELDVAPGTSRIVFQVGELSDPQADVDLYLFDCTGKNCEPRRSRVGPEGETALSLDNPAPGKWKLVVDAARTASGGVAYLYRELVFHPRYGSVSVADGPAARDVGASWESRAHVWVAEGAPPDRLLTAVLPVVGEGMVQARQSGPISFNDFEAWKVGGDSVPLGSASVDLSRPSTPPGGPR
ncbi:MAG: S8 family serine peptidase [Acidobacteriota bacterium]